jgi:hypothetical protein
MDIQGIGLGGGGAWTGFFWVGVGANGGLFFTRFLILGFHNVRKISFLAEEPSASQEGLCFMKLS